jgi:hypothetical protein
MPANIFPDKKKNGLIQAGLGCAIKKINPTPTTQDAYQAAHTFFSCAQDYKDRYQSSEREYGYHSLPDKEFFIICDDNIPQELLPCLTYLNWVHGFAKNYLIELEQQLALPAGRLLSLIPAKPMQKGIKSPAYLRLTHYYATNMLTSAEVSDAHQDIGLLTVLPRTLSPALEVYDFSDAGEWLQAEKSLSDDELLILVGETLSKITNYHFIACAHQVVRTPKERISIVYQLHATPHTQLDSTQFETEITGKFFHPFSITAEEFVLNERKHRPSVNADND